MNNNEEHFWEDVLEKLPVILHGCAAKQMATRQKKNKQKKTEQQHHRQMWVVV